MEIVAVGIIACACAVGIIICIAVDLRMDKEIAKLENQVLLLQKKQNVYAKLFHARRRRL